MTRSERITISQQALEEAQKADRDELQNASLVVRLDDGREEVVPQQLQNVLFEAIHGLAETGQVVIGQLPDELTSTVPADILSVSRPTLMKWVQEGKIAAHKVGSRSRFWREDVLALQLERDQARDRAFAQLRALDAELGETFED